MASKAWRWTKRIVLGLVAFLVFAVAILLAFLHTDFGREVTRKQVEARLNDAFIGGAKIGKLEGSVVGKLVLRDVVLNGPDKKPAITIKKMSVGVGILPLFSKQARVANLKVEDVDVDIRRFPDGTLMTSRMIKPGPSAGWAVQIPKLVVERAHVRVEGAKGAEDTNIDGIHIAGDIHMPADEPIEANLMLMAHWRERNAPIWLDTTLRDDPELLTVPSLVARIGDVRATVAGVRLIKPHSPTIANPTKRTPVFAGLVAIDASKEAIAKLAPDAKLPVDDVDLVITAAPQAFEPWTHVVLAGTIDQQPLRAEVDVDLVAKRARGLVSTGSLNLTKLSSGKLEGRGSVFASFDALIAEPMPHGTAIIHVGGDFADIPNATATIAVTSTGERAATAIIGNASGSSAYIGAQVLKHGDKLALETSRVIAKLRDPARATRGKAPVYGRLDIDLSASGPLQPEPDLAVSGRVAGSRLRAKDLTIKSLKVAIEAKHLPGRPIGKAELEARDVERGKLFLRELDVNAANRQDGKIAVTMRSRPRTSPWLVEADALVTPGDTVTIDLLRHQIRVSNGSDWAGTTGKITIGPRVIEIRDLASASKDGNLEVAGFLHRKTGDLEAHVDVKLGLENLSKFYRGTIEGRIDVARTDGRFESVIDVDAKGIALDPKVLAFDADARIEARADQLVVDLSAESPVLGAVDLDIDIDAPKDITNAAAWKKLHRQHIRSARLQLRGLDVGKLASLAKAEGEYSGRIDGDVQISPTTTGGLVQLTELAGPALKNLGPMTASLNLSETAPGELTPTFIATIDDRRAAGTSVKKPLAQVEAQATLGMPGHLFDPAAWRALGKAAFKGGSIKVDDVMIEPALLDRLQVTTNLRGRASFVAELTAAMESLKASLRVQQLRGKPIAAPVTLELVTQIDARDTTATMTVTSMDKPTKLLELDARIPISMDEAAKNPRAFRTAPLTATATLPDVSAPKLLATFGRSQIIGGTLSGTVEVAGTLEKPTMKARVAGKDLAVPPGPRNTPIKTIKNIALVASWDGTSGKLNIDATQDRGMLALAAQGDPKQLDTATMTLTAKDFDLIPLLAFAPGPAGGAAGRLDAKLEVKGFDARKTKLAGELHLTNARVPINPAVGTLRRAKIDVVIADNVKVNVDGRLGGGTLKANATFGLEGAMPTNGDAKITLRKVSPIGVVEPDVSADITAKLTRRPDAWVADIVIDKGVIKVPKARGEKLDPVGMPEDMVWMSSKKKVEKKTLEEQTRPEKPTLVANIEIRPTYIESNELRGYIRGKLRIERDAEVVGIVGKIEADRGDLDLFGRRYQLDRAVVRFDGPTDPLLDIIITHDFAEVSTRTQVRGRLSKPELIMSSNPGTYSQGQLLGFLLGGEPEGAPADGNPRDKATSAGASIVANKLAGYVQDALPIDVDVLRYEAATSTSGSAITVGTWITRSLFIAYRRRIEARPDENAGEGEVEYWLTRRVVVEGVVGDRGYNGVDLLWRKRY